MDEVTLVRDIALPWEMAWRSLELGVNVADALLRARTVNWSEWASVVRRKRTPTINVCNASVGKHG
ncbi:MAG: hypothetical protein BRC46_08550 [Cyanobacteria bacterium QS_6_48_18]|nr:MAG: hypothetical protein BRC46_08550 [Cyanobacteria bacterium QS_6_48_18]